MSCTCHVGHVISVIYYFVKVKDWVNEVEKIDILKTNTQAGRRECQVVLSDMENQSYNEKEVVYNRFV